MLQNLDIAAGAGAVAVDDAAAPARRPGADRRGARDHRPDRAARHARRRPRARPEAVAGDRHAAGAGREAAAARRAGRRHEPRRARRHRRAAAASSPRTARSSSSSTTWTSCARFARTVTVLHAGKVLSEGTVAEVQADPKVQEVYLGTAAATTLEAELGERGRAPTTDPRAGGGRACPRRRRRDAGDRRRPRRLRPQHRAARRLARRCPRTAWPPSWATTAPARARCCGRRWACSSRAAAGCCWTARTSPSCTPHERVRRGIAYVPQGQQSFPHLTTEENLQLDRRRPRRGRQDGDGRGAGPVPRADAAHVAPRPGCSPAASASSSRSPAR